MSEGGPANVGEGATHAAVASPASPTLPSSQGNIQPQSSPWPQYPTPSREGQAGHPTIPPGTASHEAYPQPSTLPSVGPMPSPDNARCDAGEAAAPTHTDDPPRAETSVVSTPSTTMGPWAAPPDTTGLVGATVASSLIEPDEIGLLIAANTLMLQSAENYLNRQMPEVTAGFFSVIDKNSRRIYELDARAIQRINPRGKGKKHAKSKGKSRSKAKKSDRP